MWYKILSWPAWRLIDLCHFYTGVLWHYYWYCNKVKGIHPQLWSKSRQMSFWEVICEQWRYSGQDGG
jgi:hypothetical protein